MTLSLNAEGLTKRFGRITAVDNLSLQVKKGEVLGFLGPNGAGKSTTMKMLTGFLTPCQGRVQIGDFDILSQPQQAKSLIGYLPEGAPAYPDMTAGQFLEFMAGMRGLTGTEKQKRLSYVIERCHIKTVWHQPIETLSKGYKRRVGLAQAILHDPAILVMDEPTDGLDPNQKREVRNLISELSEEKAIIVSTHILEEVSAVCNRAIIIAHGQILADDTPAALQKQADRYGQLTLQISGQMSDTQLAELQKTCPISEMQQAQADNGDMILTIMPQEKQDLAADISQFCLKNQLQIAHLDVYAGRLEDVFYQITASKAA